MSRARVRDCFVRAVGAVGAVGFLSLWVQLPVLLGSDGLLPACRPQALSGPSLFAWWCSDAVLAAAALAGAALGGLAALLVAPAWCLLGAWALYLSFANVGQEFLAFQWDNLLLETTVFTLAVAPWRLRGWRRPGPHPIAVVLLQWLFVRLHVESGLAKLLVGDPTWRDLTAMVSYWETAPLPTWVGWWAHQLPAWAQRGAGLATYVVELGLPVAVWGPRRLRAVAFGGIVAFQTGVIATANYGFFNYLSIALCLWLLDDAHLPGRAGGRPARTHGWGPTVGLVTVAALAVPLSLVPFLRFVPQARPQLARLAPVVGALDAVRSLNAYHLFASMTLVRREAVIEASRDGTTWEPYEFRWKPGDPVRAPAFVAPHQPRVDFQLWFLLLGRRGVPEYVDTLLRRLVTTPRTVAPLFARMPFGSTPPVMVRLAVYRYRFTDRATRAATGAWWSRTLEGHGRPVHAGPGR